MDNINKLVIEEATKLRQHATQKEKYLLNSEHLSPDSARLCIYGLMTGDCWSQRSAILLNACAVPFSEQTLKFETPTEKRFRSSIGRCFSPIECFIYQASKEVNALLIAYIKGEKETLTEDEL